MLGSVRVSGADVFVLQGLELLLCAEFVGLPIIHTLANSNTAFGKVVFAYHFVEWCGVRSGLVLARLRLLPGSCRKQNRGNSAAAERHMSNAKSTRASRVLQHPTHTRAFDITAP
jgi:hypothetical protein